MPTPTALPDVVPSVTTSRPDLAARPTPQASDLIDDPRGGWRFRDAHEQALLGADAVSPQSAPPPPDPQPLPEPADLERLRFQGNAQYPAHSHPHAGTQGTWDDSLGPHGGPHGAESTAGIAIVPR